MDMFEPFLGFAVWNLESYCPRQEIDPGKSTNHPGKQNHR